MTGELGAKIAIAIIGASLIFALAYDWIKTAKSNKKYRDNTRSIYFNYIYLKDHEQSLTYKNKEFNIYYEPIFNEYRLNIYKVFINDEYVGYTFELHTFDKDRYFFEKRFSCDRDINEIREILVEMSKCLENKHNILATLTKNENSYFN